MWIVLFFGVVTLVNATMIVLALRTMPGVQVRNAYEASQTYNRERERILAQDALGLEVEISKAGLRSEGMFSVMVRDRNGAPVTGLEAELRLARPVNQRFDLSRALVEGGGGRYGVQLPPLAAGQWVLTLDLARGETLRHRSDSRIMIE
jgi:nitrogen fixation protein FixH